MEELRRVNGNDVLLTATPGNSSSARSAVPSGMTRRKMRQQQLRGSDEEAARVVDIMTLRSPDHHLNMAPQLWHPSILFFSLQEGPKYNCAVSSVLFPRQIRLCPVPFFVLRFN